MEIIAKEAIFYRIYEGDFNFKKVLDGTVLCMTLPITLIKHSFRFDLARNYLFSKAL